MEVDYRIVKADKVYMYKSRGLQRFTQESLIEDGRTLYVVEKRKVRTSGILWWKKEVEYWQYVDWHFSCASCIAIIDALKGVTPEVVWP